MPLLTRQHVLGDDLDPYLHRGAAREVDARVRRHQLTHVDRFPEVHLVHRHRDARLRGMADRGHRGHPVHQPQDDAAEHVAQDVRVLRHHQLRHDRFRVARMLGLHQ